MSKDVFIEHRATHKILLKMPIPDPADISAILLVAMGFIGFFCTLFTLGMIHSMGRSNSYILLVASLTVAQLFYDVSVILVLLPLGNQ